MSIQFGIWSFAGCPVEPGYLGAARDALAPYSDRYSEHRETAFHVLCFPPSAAKQPMAKEQPLVRSSGLVLTFDGRLDNRPELIGELELDASLHDSEILAAAYERWREDSFAKLVGDWAVSVWDPLVQTLCLAKDFLGSRPLFYRATETSLTWSSRLEPILSLVEKPLHLEQEYVAGYLCSWPETHLSPFTGISSVPPSSYVLIRKRNVSLHQYWNFDSQRRISYRSDLEYEEEFRCLFTRSVARRLRSDRPVLAELSGGVDSTSIVCVADRLIAQGQAAAPRLDTVSYFNNSEPNWNEKPYFELVEQFRRQSGHHIDLACREPFRLPYDDEGLPTTPVARRQRQAPSAQFSDLIQAGQFQVLLSGVGGDETTGGVPTPLPELRDLMASGRWLHLSRQLGRWAFNKRQPWLRLFLETLVGFLKSTPREPIAWIHPAFVRGFPNPFRNVAPRLTFFGARPSFQDSLHTFANIRRQIALAAAVADPRYETRYPFLDRDLLEFVFAIPREQLVRPGQRRSLLRRAMAGLVPAEILDRKRKAFVVRAPVAALSLDPVTLGQLRERMLCAELGFIGCDALFQAIKQVRLGLGIDAPALLRTLGLEAWLRRLQELHVFSCESQKILARRRSSRLLRLIPSLRAQP